MNKPRTSGRPRRILCFTIVYLRICEELHPTWCTCQPSRLRAASPAAGDECNGLADDGAALDVAGRNRLGKSGHHPPPQVDAPRTIPYTAAFAHRPMIFPVLF